jgi:hypothetical protein
MTAKTIYVATDGERFDEQSACEQYEADGCVHFRPIPDYCDHFLIAGNIEAYLGGDGSLYYATDTRMSRISPTRKPHPAWATHLVYFGK